MQRISGKKLAYFSNVIKKKKKKASMELYLSQMLFSGIQHGISTMQISI